MSIKLVAFDVDGTLLRGRTICECIAAGIGKHDEMRAFEQLTSIADIECARATMISWYKSYDRASLIEYVRTATLANGARDGVARLKRRGVQVALLSITWQFAVEWLRNELGADFAIGTRWRDDGGVDHVWPESKAEWLAEYAARMSLHPENVVAVGDSAGDLPMLRFAGAGYYVGQHASVLPPHVKHWPGADITAVVADLLGGQERASPG
jgi:HAD superfamily phosphoserine phosphatase-like hydrolase